MAETLEQMVARINASGYLPPDPLIGVRRMAQKVKLSKGKDFQFRSASAVASKYPWADWLNGDLLLLERSTGKENDKGTIVEIEEKKDYEVLTNAMPPKLTTSARRKYKIVQISRLDADGKKLKDALIIRARDMTPEEKTAEDLRRAEEKANRAAEADGEDDDTVTASVTE